MQSNVVLIIDDDEDDRSMFSEALQEVNPDFILLQSTQTLFSIELIYHRK